MGDCEDAKPDVFFDELIVTIIFGIEFSPRRFCPVLFDAGSVHTEQRCCPSDERRRRNRVSRGFLCFQTRRLCRRFPPRDSTAPLRPRRVAQNIC